MKVQQRIYVACILLYSAVAASETIPLSATRLGGKSEPLVLSVPAILKVQSYVQNIKKLPGSEQAWRLKLRGITSAHVDSSLVLRQGLDEIREHAELWHKSVFPQFRGLVVDLNASSRKMQKRLDALQERASPFTPYSVSQGSGIVSAWCAALAT